MTNEEKDMEIYYKAEEERHNKHNQWWMGIVKDPMWVNGNFDGEFVTDPPYNPPKNGYYRIVFQGQYSIGDSGDYGLEDETEFKAYFGKGYWFRTYEEYQEWQNEQPQYMPSNYALDFEGGINAWKHTKESYILSKQIPRKPEVMPHPLQGTETRWSICPNCGANHHTEVRYNYCDLCGQRIDWSSFLKDERRRIAQKDAKRDDMFIYPTEEQEEWAKQCVPDNLIEKAKTLYPEMETVSKKYQKDWEESIHDPS